MIDRARGIGCDPGCCRVCGTVIAPRQRRNHGAITLMFKTVAPAAVALLLTFVPQFSHSADVAEADAARKKPLQRCDQLSDKAEIECLQKARERVVDARRKREAAATGARIPSGGAHAVPTKK